MNAWSLGDLPSLTGRRALVTGATSGLGLRAVTELAKAGAEVILAARDPERLERTVKQVILAAPRTKVEPLVCDLADLASVRTAAKNAGSFGPISILVNNAGVMATSKGTTADGFDLQFGTNHLGHFALTGLLLEQLLDSGRARVVTVSSLMARGALQPPLGDPRAQNGRYGRWRAYTASKLANLLFMLELHRRVTARGLPVTSVGAHPGYARTGLQREIAIIDAVSGLVGQSAELGALPLLMAATASGLRGGTYVGPSGPFELHGAPRVVQLPRPALHEDNARRLWEISEQATGVRYL